MQDREATDDLPLAEAIKRLGVDLDTGLTESQVESRRREFGPNEIPERERSLAERIIKRFWGPIPWMIEAAALLSAIVQKWEDLAIILALLAVNVIIDFRQEAKALGALRLLREKLATKALVLREGVWSQIDARQLVPGDIVKLRIGNIVPADVRLAQGEFLQIDQSALTGESLPADKSPGDVAYANSIVKMGEMVAVVTGTGLNTYFGRTVELVARADRQQRSHFQNAVINVGNFLIILAAVMVVLIVLVGLFRHDPVMEIIRFALVLTIASIPVALPAVLSVTMAVGAVQLARRQAIVRRLVAIEELAGVDVLCCDKTGTLTQNTMKLGRIETWSDATREQVLVMAALSSREEDQDPLETPIFQAVREAGLDAKVHRDLIERFVPFDPVRKRTEVRVGGPEAMIVTKGAPQAVLSLCRDEALAGQVNRRVEAMAGKGYRTLGVAVKRGDEPVFQFVGLMPMYDPPREDSAELVAEARRLGVQIKMVTGDNLAIAAQIARVLGIGGDIRDIEDLKKEKPTELLTLAGVLTDSLYSRLKPDATRSEIDAARADVIARLGKALEEMTPEQHYVKKHESEIIGMIERTGGFAQVFPEDKYLIVDRLQKADHIVGMTGDGVNDAPALRKADAGIAVSGATDAARAAADLVLLLPGLSVIIDAMKEARKIFGRMQSYAIFRIAETVRVILFMTLAITIFNFYPVTAIMIIVLALLNDIPIMAIAYDNTRVEPQPVRWNMKEVLTIASVLGLLGVISSFLAFYILEALGLPRDFIQAVLFLKLSVAGHSTLYVARSREHAFWRRPLPSLRLFIPTFGTQIIATVIACFGLLMTPIGWEYSLYVWIYALVWFLINDFVKVRVYRIRQNHGHSPEPGAVHPKAAPAYR